MPFVQFPFSLLNPCQPISRYTQEIQQGVHFGQLTRKWNPNMAPYIYMERNGIHIINLYKTAAKLEEANEALKKIASSGRKILFVATKKQAKDIVAEKAGNAQMPYITERWPGGMLTNFVTIRKAVKKINDLLKRFEENYEVRDKQDVLAMCALQFASLQEVKSVYNGQDAEKIEHKLIEMNEDPKTK